MPPPVAPWIAAVVPLNALDRAKSRLAPALDVAARRALVAQLATGVIRACGAAQQVRRVLVVAGCDDGAAVARACGVEAQVVGEPGLDAALAHADAYLTGETATLVVVGDLPHVTAADIDAVCTLAIDCERCVVVAPTRDGGTGALLRRPPQACATAFGPASAEAHHRLARDAGAPVVTVHRDGLTRDLDNPTDLALLRPTPSAQPRDADQPQPRSA